MTFSEWYRGGSHGGNDPFRDEGAANAERLGLPSGEVTSEDFEDVNHGFARMLLNSFELD